MEYVQERVTTLHDLSAATPSAPTDRAAVVVPMAEREVGGLAAEQVLTELAAVDPALVVVPLRASADRARETRDWLADFDLSLDVLWCGGPRLSDLLATHGLDREAGKGLDVWLGIGRALAADAEYVVVHDADTQSYTRQYVPRLLFPLAHGHAFTKGYYARVEDRRLYGRLFRLFYAPLVDALREGTATGVDAVDGGDGARNRGDDAGDRRADARDRGGPAPVVDYLGAFRYALAGEFAVTADLARHLHLQPGWGLEVGMLCDAFARAGFARSAQVDLGRYEHDHRAVGGPTGLSDMSEAVGEALLRCVEDHGVDPDYETLRGRYREAAAAFVRRYAVDAAFNGFAYDRGAERDQIDVYADAVVPPGPDDRLPAWAETALSPAAVAEAAGADLDAEDAADAEGAR